MTWRNVPILRKVIVEDYNDWFSCIRTWILGTIRWMAPEICTPPPEASSYESDMWSFGCMVLETTSGREPWIDQYPEDILLFRALQRKENASVFTRICSNQAGPSHIRELLLRCCAWSKSDRPRFTHILNDFRTQDDGETFSDARADCMSVDSPTSDDQPVSENEYEEPSGNYQESLQTPTNRSFDTPDRIFHRRTTVPEPTRPQARLTGEVFTSKGTASGRPIYEGVKGGRYYLTPSGSKVYLHKWIRPLRSLLFFCSLIFWSSINVFSFFLSDNDTCIIYWSFKNILHTSQKKNTAIKFSKLLLKEIDDCPASFVGTISALDSRTNEQRSRSISDFDRRHSNRFQR